LWCELANAVSLHFDEGLFSQHPTIFTNLLDCTPAQRHGDRDKERESQEERKRDREREHERERKRERAREGERQSE